MFANVRYELADNINFSAKGIWNQRKSKNQAAPLPFGVGPAAGITPVLDDIDIDVTNPFNPFGVTLDDDATRHLHPIAASSRAVRAGSSRRSTPFTASPRSTASSTSAASDWYWDVNAAYGRNKAKQTMFGNINADHLRTALGPLAHLQLRLAGLRAVQPLRRRRDDHARR